MPYIHCDGARIAYDAIGRGPVVLLLHSTASSSAQWDALRHALADRFTMVAVDLHGYGRSDPWPGGTPASLDHEAAAVRRVMDRFDGPMHLVGHSYGGAVALKLALSGRSLASLTLAEPVAFHLLRDGSDFDRGLLREFARLGEDVDRRILAGRHAEGMQRFVDYWNGAGTWAGIAAERQQALCRMAGAVSRNFSAVLGDPARLTDCAFLFTPTLLMAGDRTPRPTARVAARLAATLPSVDVRRVEGAGHMLTRTHPNTFLQALLVHLGRCADGEAEFRRRSAA
jgi:pimeloyl-ACP methyl ester carboxylesterase